jgi:hypothetical protein
MLVPCVNNKLEENFFPSLSKKMKKNESDIFT